MCGAQSASPIQLNPARATRRARSGIVVDGGHVVGVDRQVGTDVLADEGEVLGRDRFGQHDAIGEFRSQSQRPRSTDTDDDRREHLGRVGQSDVRERDVAARCGDRFAAQQRADACSVSRSMVSGLAGQLPACRIQPGMPWPITDNHPARVETTTVASSIAAKAGLRAAAGRMPIPTVIREVAASTATV